MFLYADAALFALFVWWFSTGAILFLDGLPRPTFKYSLAGATVLTVAALFGLAQSAHNATPNGAFVAFACGLTVWAWQEITFYMGAVTGPRKHLCEEGCSGWKHFGHALQVSLWHELSIVAFAIAVVAVTWGWRQSGRHLDVHGALVDARKRAAQRHARRAQPERGVPAGPPVLFAQLPAEAADERAVPGVRHAQHCRLRADGALRPWRPAPAHSPKPA